jgi:hypothetical protein
VALKALTLDQQNQLWLRAKAETARALAPAPTLPKEPV